MYNVIIVDDEPMIKLTLRKLIDSNNSHFNVVGEAEDGQEALELAEQLLPDLIITDIRMPVMDGLELIQEVKERRLRTDFIIISGHDDFAYAQQALRFGTIDYLLKPLKPALLEETLKRVYERFQSEKKSLLDRTEWLWYCKNSAEQLVEKLWLLNETEVQLQLSDIHRLLVEKNLELPLLKQFYVDLLSLIAGELAQRNGEHVQPDPAEAAELPEQTDEIRRTIEEILIKAMDEIRKTRNWASHQNIARAIEYMEQKFANETLSLQEVAEHSGMSPAYLSRLFKEETGITFIQHLTQLRMEHAKSLLSDPLCKSYEIAYSSGYSDYPHFAKVFKKYSGVTPTEYRKRAT